MSTSSAAWVSVPRADRFWLLAILLAAAAFRLYEIGFPDIWVDEANLILTAGRPLGELFSKLRVDSSPPLYYLAIHLWGALFGDSAVALRLLSVLSGVALVGTTWWVGNEFVSSRAGLWGAFYLAVNPSQSFFSQQVRMYVWLGLLSLISLAALVRYLRDGRRGDFALWVLSSVLALYNHNFAIHLGVAHGVLILVSGQLQSRIRMWVLAAVVVAASYGPWIPTLLGQLGNADHYAWYLPLWEGSGAWVALIKSLRSISPSVEFLNYAGIGSFKTLYGLPTIGACGLAALGIWISIRRIRDSGAVVALWPVIGLVAPAASALTLSGLLTPHYVPGRVDQMMLPEFALLIGVAIASLRPVALRAALGVAILALGIIAKVSMYDDYRDPESDGGDRAAAFAIMDAWQPGDVIVTTSLSRASLAYYLHRNNRYGNPGANGESREARVISYPRASAEHLGAQNDARLLADKPGLMRETAATLEEARVTAGSRGRVFVLWVQAIVNYPLRQGALEPYGYTEVALLGRYRQFGTGLMMEVRQYRPQ